MAPIPLVCVDAINEVPAAGLSTYPYSDQSWWRLIFWGEDCAHALPHGGEHRARHFLKIMGG
jgi:hypothetical protein